MKVSEVRALLADVPDYYEVMVGPAFVSDVRLVTRVVRERESHGGKATNGAVVVVIE